MSRLLGRMQAAAAWCDRRQRWLVCAGLVVAIGDALLTTADVVHNGRPYYAGELAAHGDFARIYAAASASSWRDVPRWWVGRWINTGVGYYRPVTSMLFFAERRAFDQDFDDYNRVTWILHGLNAGLVYLLAISLLRHRRRSRLLLGLAAAFAFANRDGSFGFAIGAAIRWWPAQNDPLSLLFGLACLVPLDRYLLARRRPWLICSLVALAMAIGAKEMGHAAALMALLLIYWRSRGLHRSMLAVAAVSAGLVLVRQIAVPNLWTPHPTAQMLTHKLLAHVFSPVALQVAVGTWWPVVAAALTVVMVAIGIRKRLAWWQVACACVFVTALAAQCLGGDGGWALLLIPGGLRAYWGDLTYVSSVALVAACRKSEPATLAVAWYLLAFAPILGYIGTHYYYWVAAFFALLQAVVWACGLDLLVALWGERWKAWERQQVPASV